MTASLAEKLGHLGYPGCIGVLALLALVSACAGPQSPAESAFEEGTVPTEALVAVAEETARIQTFVADAERVVDLQVMVARGVDAGEHPLLVEVRNTDLDRRYGHGKIPAFDAQPFVPAWKSVEWVERPVLERGETYTLVFMTDAPDPDWQLAVALGSYPYGQFSHFEHVDFDVGFRIQFTNAVTQSSLATVRDSVTPYPFERLLQRGQSWGERYYFPLDGKLVIPLLEPQKLDPRVRNRRSLRAQQELRELPHCLEKRCFEQTSTLLGTPEERAERARRATRSSGEAPVESLSFETGALGVSCRDVCRGHGFVECAGTRNLPSCQSVVSSTPKRDDATCLCGHEVLPREISDDAEVVEKRVHTFFELDDRDRPQLKPGRVAAGLTCTQVCEVLGPGPCEGDEDCTREITPDFSKCPTCKSPGMTEQAKDFRRLSTPVGDKLATIYGGEIRVITPASNATESFALKSGSDLADMTGYAVGRFAVWSRGKSPRYVGRNRYAEGESARFVALDTQSGDVYNVSIDVRERALLCLAAAHPRSLEGLGSLAVICFEETTTSIYPVTGDKRHEAPPTYGRKVRSWDGKTAVVASTLSQRVWSIGSSQWTREESNARHRDVFPSSRKIDEFQYLIADDAGHPNVIDGHFYGHYSNRIWRFNPENIEFEAWELPSSRDVTISKALIRVGSYVFDLEQEVFKHVPASILHDVGTFGFIEAAQCPEQLPCRPLEAPLNDFAVLSLNVGDYETAHIRKSSEIDPDDPPGFTRFYDFSSK